MGLIPPPPPEAFGLGKKRVLSREEAKAVFEKKPREIEVATDLREKTFFERIVERFVN